MTVMTIRVPVMLYVLSTKLKGVIFLNIKGNIL